MYLCQLVPPKSLVNLAVGLSWHTLPVLDFFITNPFLPFPYRRKLYTTADSQLPYKTNITAKVPSCQFALYNTYRSISHKSTVPCPSSRHLLTRQLQLPTGGTPSMLFALYPANQSVAIPSVGNINIKHYYEQASKAGTSGRGRKQQG